MRRVFRTIPQVVVIFYSSFKVVRDLRRGILKYARQHGPWGIHLIEGRPNEQKLLRLKEWGCTGIIGRLYTPELIQAVISAKLPTVIFEPPAELCRPAGPFSKCGLIRSDSPAIGRMAAEYLLSLNFTHFAYVGDIHGSEWSVSRGNAFRAVLRKEGVDCSVYPTATFKKDRDASADRRRLCDWLLNLPKPVALFGATDTRGRQVIDACRLAGINVPQEAAVLGVDNDEDICETCTPALSSIAFEAERVGYEGMLLLDQLMRGSVRKPGTITYGPGSVIGRQSTDISHITDIVISRAREFIALNARAGIGVSDVVREIKVSRRLAELKFRQILGHTILEEIQLKKLEHARMMLKETLRSIAEITASCGFETATHLGVLFRRHYGCTMSEYRAGKDGRDQGDGARTSPPFRRRSVGDPVL